MWSNLYLKSEIYGYILIKFFNRINSVFFVIIWHYIIISIIRKSKNIQNILIKPTSIRINLRYTIFIAKLFEDN